MKSRSTKENRVYDHQKGLSTYLFELKVASLHSSFKDIISLKCLFKYNGCVINQQTDIIIVTFHAINNEKFELNSKSSHYTNK